MAAGRVDRIVEQQQKAIESFATFLENAVDPANALNPSKLVVAYAGLWKDWAKQIAEISRLALSDNP